MSEIKPLEAEMKANPSRSTIVNRMSLIFAIAVLFAIGLRRTADGQTLQYSPVITTYVGGATTVCSAKTDTYGDGCTALSTILGSPWGQIADKQGNLYFTEFSHNLVRRVDAITGIVTVVAGIPAGSTNTVCAAKTDGAGDGCPATQATLHEPMGLAFDPFGNLVIADYGNQLVRSINAQTNVITVIAGVIAPTASAGTAATAVPNNASPLPSGLTKVGEPSYVAFDAAGNLYITTQTTQNVSVVVATNGAIVPSTSLMYNLAGNGTAGYSGVNVVATTAELDNPRPITLDAAGNVYVGDFQTCDMRKITSPFQGGTLNLSGAIITTVAGTGVCSTTVTSGGQATATLFEHTEDAKIDKTGILYVSQQNSPGDSVRAINYTSGVVTTFAGNGTRGNTNEGGPAATAEINGASGVSFDYSAHTFISAYTGNTIRRVSLGNVFPQQAVGGVSASQNVIAKATQALTLQSATITPSTSTEFKVGTLTGCSIGGALALSAYCTVPIMFQPALPGLRSQQIVLTDSNNVSSTIGLSGIGLAPAIVFSPGKITTIAGNGVSGPAGASGPASSSQVDGPRGGMIDGAVNIFFADSGNNVIRRIDAVSGAISTVAGTGTSGYAGDTGAATSAQLHGPTKVAVDPAGNLYIADTGNNAIRFVDVNTGLISTIAGNGTLGYTGDGGPATAAAFSNPQGLAVDRGGNIYVADTGNNALRFFTIGGPITTIAGNGTAGYSGDANPAGFAKLNGPMAVIVDFSGDIFIADTGNGVIREISSSNQISTIAGTQGTNSNTGDGGVATNATLSNPSDIALDAAGDLYIASGGVVRLVNSAGVISTIAGTGASGSYSGEGGAATSATLASSTFNIMLDGSANLYISDTLANRFLEAASATIPSLTFTKQAPGSTGSSQVYTVLNVGNSPLVLSNLTVSTNFVLQTSDASACTPTTTLTAGQSCTLTVAFSPTTGTSGTLTGAVTLTDNALNGTAVTQTISLTGVAGVIAVTTTATAISPSSIVYGNTASAIATISGGTSPAGQVTFVANGVTLGTVNLVSGQATISLGVPFAGPLVVTASYSGDNNNSSSSGVGNATVQPAVLTVTAGNATKADDLPNPPLTYTITGFVNGDTSSVVSGTPGVTTVATTTSSPGTYDVTPSIGTLAASNYTFVFVKGTLTILPSDFTLTVSPTTLSVYASLQATTLVSITSPSYTGTVKLSCSKLPPNVTCGFLEGSLTGDPTAPDQTVSTNLNISTDVLARNDSLSISRRVESIFSAISIPLFSISFFFMRKRRRRLLNLLAAAVLFCVGMGVSSCSTGPENHVALPGISQITITAADSAGLSHSAIVTLTIQ